MKIFTKILTAVLSATMLFSVVGFSACTNGEMEAKIAELEAQISTQQEQIADLQEQNANLQADVTEQQTQISTQQTQIAELEQENEDLQASITEQQAQILEQQTQIEQQQEQIAELEQENQDLQADITEKQEQIEALEQENQELEDMKITVIREEEIAKAFIVSDRQAYDEIFNDSVGVDVDFDNEMIIVCTFGIEYVHPFNIYNIELSNGILEIKYSIQLIRGTGSAVPPYQRWVAVKLDKLDIDSIKNTLVYLSVGEFKEDIQDSSFNAMIFDNCGDWISESFKTNNPVNGAIN